MGALFKLQAKAYFANIFSKIDFFMAVIFLLVLGSLASTGLGYNNPMLWKANIAIISSITIFMVMNSALFAFGFSFFEMKNSVLLKRIGATKISKFEAISSFLAWGMTTMLFTIIWISLWVGVFQIPYIAEHTGGLLYVDSSVWKNVNWVGVVLAILITAISFYSIAFFLVSIFKDAEQYNIATTFYMFIFAFLGGVFTPNAGRDWMDVIGYMSPLGWGSELMQHSMVGANVFNFHGYDISLGPIIHEHISSLKAIGHFIFPLIYGGLAAGGSLKLFKWD